MSKRALSLFVSVVMVLSVCCILFVYYNKVVSGQEDETIILEIESKMGFYLQDVENDIKTSEAMGYKFQGIATIDNQEITFGVFNSTSLPNPKFLTQIDEELKGFIKHYAEVDNVSDSQFTEVKATVKIKIFSFQDRKSKIEKMKGKFTAENTKVTDVTTKKISKAERDKAKIN